jgi:hypothetical protein
MTKLKKDAVSSKNYIVKLKQNLANAESTLNSLGESYSLSNSPINVRLKNPDL